MWHAERDEGCFHVTAINPRPEGIARVAAVVAFVLLPVAVGLLPRPESEICHGICVGDAIYGRVPGNVLDRLRRRSPGWPRR